MATGVGSFRKLTTPKGKDYWEYRVERRSYYGDTKKECMEKYKAYSSQNNEIKKRYKNITLTEWSCEWLEKYKNGKIEYSYFTHIKSIVKNHITPIMGDSFVHSILPADIENFNTKMLGYSYSLRRQSFNALNQIFEAAVDNGICEKNPCKKSSVKNIKGEKRDLKIKVFAPEELKLIIENAPNVKYGYYILLALYSGMRRGELIALKWADIDDLTIHITKAVGLAEHGQTEKCPKSRKPRIVGATANLKAVLDTIPRESEYVLAGEKGGAVSLNGFETRYKKAFSDIQSIVGADNLHYLSPHKCRHTFATYLADSGVPAKDIMALLGHSSLSITQVYFSTDTKNLISSTNKLPY